MSHAVHWTQEYDKEEGLYPSTRRLTKARGGDLGETGDCPPKFEVGDGPCIGPPIFREVVLSDVRENMNRVKKGVFLVRKGSNMKFNIAKIGKIWEKKWKIWSITKKMSSEIFAAEMHISPQKSHSEILGPPKKIRRQVSATD